MRLNIFGREIRVEKPEQEDRSSLAIPDDQLQNALSNPSHDFWFSDLGRGTAAGRPVNENTAMQFSAFYAAVRIRAQAISTLPLVLYERSGEGERRRAETNPLYSVLHTTPNRFQSSVEWLEMTSLNLDLYGNAYTFIQRDNAGRVVQLIPVHSGRITIEWDKRTGERFYVLDHRVAPDSVFSTSEMMHFTGLSIDGVQGISLLRAAKETIAHGLALEDFGSRFFANDSTSGLVLSHPQTIGSEGVEGLRKAWEAGRTGRNQHRVHVLQEGVKAERITIAPEDSQFIESRQFSIQEIARFCGVPPHLLGDLSRATFSNIEQQSLDFLLNTIGPALRKIETRINKSLLANDPSHFVEFLVDARQRVDYKSRHEGYQLGIQNGFYTVNEVRRWENLPPMEGGDVLRFPLNTAPALGEPERASTPATETRRLLPPETRALPEHTRIRDQYVERFEKTADELLEEEIPAVRRIVEANADPGQLRRELEAYFRNHRSTVERKLEPLYREFMTRVAESNARDLDQDPPDLRSFIADVIESASLRWVNSSRDQLNALDTSEERLTRLDEWSKKRAGKFANIESVQMQNAATRATLVALGITRLVWRTRNPCPLCDGLDGRTVGIQEDFVSEGEDVNGLIAPRSLKNPPLHQGCQCFLSHE